MATLGDLKQRIIDETNRDDLQDELASALNRVIADAIDFYQAERWVFDENRTTSACTPDNEYIDRPAGTRIVDRPFLLIGGVRYRLIKRSNAHIEGLYTTPLKGQPTDYAEYGDSLRLWPTPNLAYTIIWLTIWDVTALDYSDDTSENSWTNEGARLIAARAKLLLFRDYFRDDAAYARAKVQMDEAYNRLKGETNRRLGTGRVRPSP